MLPDTRGAREEWVCEGWRGSSRSSRSAGECQFELLLIVEEHLHRGKSGIPSSGSIRSSSSIWGWL